jgi:hypothetical protein
MAQLFGSKKARRIFGLLAFAVIFVQGAIHGIVSDGYNWLYGALYGLALGIVLDRDVFPFFRRLVTDQPDKSGDRH